MDLSKFGARLQSLREEHGLLQKEVADKVGIARATLASYETGRRAPEAATLAALAAFFGVSTDYLLGRTDERTEPTFTRHRVPNDLPPDIAAMFAALPKETRDALAYAQRQLTPDDWRAVARVLLALVEELGQKTDHPPK